MRKEKTITLEDRGTPLVFRICEMPATQLESWILRALLLLAGTGAEMPPSGEGLDALGGYLQKHGLAALGGIDFNKAKPLLDELLGCCHRKVGNAEEQVTTETVDACISDVKTLFTLRCEALKLNLAFFNNAAPSASPGSVTIARPSRKSGV